MKDEINAAATFLIRLIGSSNNFDEKRMNEMERHLVELLTKKFDNHWFPDRPLKGQGYRCIRVNEYDRKDAILELACKKIGMCYENLKMPAELTLWIDPEEVTCRFGEHKGSYCILAKFKGENKENYVDQINITELERKSLERAKQAAFELMSSRRKKFNKNNAYRNGNSSNNGNGNGNNGIGNNGWNSNGVSNGYEYGGGQMGNSGAGDYMANYYGSSPGYSSFYGTSPPQQLAGNGNGNGMMNGNGGNAGNQVTATPVTSAGNQGYHHQLSPNSARQLAGSPYRNSPVLAVPQQQQMAFAPGNCGNNSKFVRNLNSAFNSATMVDAYPQGDRYHWMNKSFFKA